MEVMTRLLPDSVGAMTDLEMCPSHSCGSTSFFRPSFPSSSPLLPLSSALPRPLPPLLPRSLPRTLPQALPRRLPRPLPQVLPRSRLPA